MLMIIAAKWCHCMIENARTSSTSKARAAADSSATAVSRTISTAAGERHEAHRQQLAGGNRAVLALFDEHQMLDEERTAHRNDHASARPQLLDQRRWNVARRGGDDDAVERRRFLPAVVSVAGAHGDVVVVQPDEARLRSLRPLPDDRDA